MVQRYWEVSTSCYQEGLADVLCELQGKPGLPFTMGVQAADSFYTVLYGYETGEEQADGERVLSRIYQYYLAQALTETICQQWEKPYIEKILRRQYGLTREQQLTVQQRCAEQNRRRRKILTQSILEYIDKHSSFCIEGFVNFQAGLYKAALCREIEQTVRAVEWEEEEREFTSCLRRVLAAKGVRMSVVHMIIGHSGEVFLYDGDRQGLPPKAEDAYESLGVQGKKELHEDLLVRFLLELAPAMMIVHVLAPLYKELLKMLERVFGERFHRCEGCSFCLNH